MLEFPFLNIRFFQENKFLLLYKLSKRYPHQKSELKRISDINTELFALVSRKNT